MAETARYNLKTISIERNQTTTLLMSICRELDISVEDLELLILDEYESNWKALDKTYVYLQLPISKAQTMNPTLRVSLAIKCEWIKQREPLVFNKWYDREEAEELIKAYDLDLVDVIGTNEHIQGSTDNSLGESLSKNSERYVISFYDLDDECWEPNPPVKVMFFKAPME